MLKFKRIKAVESQLNNSFEQQQQQKTDSKSIKPRVTVSQVIDKTVNMNK